MLCHLCGQLHLSQNQTDMLTFGTVMQHDCEAELLTTILLMGSPSYVINRTLGRVN